MRTNLLGRMQAGSEAGGLPCCEDRLRDRGQHQVGRLRPGNQRGRGNEAILRGEELCELPARGRQQLRGGPVHRVRDEGPRLVLLHHRLRANTGESSPEEMPYVEKCQLFYASAIAKSKLYFYKFFFVFLGFLLAFFF